MNIALCSISFRYELISFQKLVQFAHQHSFSGIELWGVHARALMKQQAADVERCLELLDSLGLNITMISDYYDLGAKHELKRQQTDKWNEIVRTARSFQTDRVRIFAGSQSSRSVTEQVWELCITRLQELARRASEDGMYIVIETHPDTHADSLDSTMRLLREVQHPRVKINLDFLHLWESGTEPLEAYRLLAPHIVNMHVKNVASINDVHLFAPSNVFSPSGSREGMTSLADGAIDYETLFDRNSQSIAQCPIALEWFGGQPAAYLAAERRWLGKWDDRNSTHLKKHDRQLTVKGDILC